MQGLIANETQRIFITGRGPRGVRTLFGLNQPYFFSTHLNSDMYAHPALGQMRLAGARTAHILYEDYGNFFYTDLGTNAADGAAAFGYTVTTGVLIRAAGTNFNLTLLNASLDAAIAAAPDVLVLVLRQPEWAATLARLSGLRPGTAALKRGERRHAFKAVWFQVGAAAPPPSQHHTPTKTGTPAFTGGHSRRVLERFTTANSNPATNYKPPKRRSTPTRTPTPSTPHIHPTLSRLPRSRRPAPHQRPTHHRLTPSRSNPRLQHRPIDPKPHSLPALTRPPSLFAGQLLVWQLRRRGPALRSRPWRVPV
jgi:hypothetical protein